MLPARAESTDTNQLVQEYKKLSLEELMNVRIRNRYGASKHEQSINEAPLFVTIVTRDDIQKFGCRTLKDILNSVPGFYTTSDGVFDYLGDGRFPSGTTGGGF